MYTPVDQFHLLGEEPTAVVPIFLSTGNHHSLTLPDICVHLNSQISSPVPSGALEEAEVLKNY